MIPRRIIAALLLPIPVLLVTFAVLMGGSALADATAAKVLTWVAMAALLLLIIDLLLLLMALGIRAVGDEPGDDDRPA